jgi:hypothetical protein
MSPLPLGIVAASLAGGKYFIGWLNTPDDYANSVNAIDINSAGDFVISGSSLNTSKVAGWIFKIKRSDLTIAFEKILRDSSNYQRIFRDVAFDPTNPDVCYVATESGFNPAIIKFDSTGAVSWAKEVGSNASRQGFGVTVDSSGNPILIGNDNAGTGNGQLYTVKYDSAGNYSWQKALAFASGVSDQQVVTDTSNNVYVSGGAFDSYYRGVVAKYNSSGTLQWQKQFNDGTSCQIHGITVDSSANVYVSGRYSPSGVDGFIAKINSSGTLQWQKRVIGAGASTDISWRVSTDTPGNVYLAGEYPSGSTSRGYLIKFSSSGSTTWQRQFYVSGVSTRAHDVKVAPDGAIYLRGINAENSFVAALPSDGSLTGSYSVGGLTFIYDSSSFSISDSSITFENASGSDITRTSTSANFSSVSVTPGYSWSSLVI